MRMKWKTRGSMVVPIIADAEPRRTDSGCIYFFIFVYDSTYAVRAYVLPQVPPLQTM